MNKQQLASKIWESANNMRGKIEANEYKDYLLGFIFYKFLSDKEVNYLKNDGWTDDVLPNLVEQDSDIVNCCKNNIGYKCTAGKAHVPWPWDVRRMSIVL